MPYIHAVHYNPPANNRKARCGKYLDKVIWRTDPADATCNSCRRLIARDKLKGVRLND